MSSRPANRDQNPVRTSGLIVSTGGRTEHAQTCVDLIEALKRGGDPEPHRGRLLGLIADHYADVDCVLLACSELPLAFEHGSTGEHEFVDASRVYIEELIRLAR